MSYLVNPYMVKASVVTTWDQLVSDCDGASSCNYVQSNDWYAFAVKIEAGSTVITDPVTDVQWKFNGYNDSVGDGSVSCCRWEDLTAFTASTPATLLSQANHTYWTMDVTSTPSPSSWTSNTVTSSTKLEVNNLVGIVIHGGTSSPYYNVLGMFYKDFLTGYAPYRASAGSTSTYSSTPTFTITTTS